MTYQASFLGSSIGDPQSLTVLLSRDQNCSHPPWLLDISVSVSGNLGALAILRPQVGRLQRLLTFSSRAVESLQVTIICAEEPEGGLAFATVLATRTFLSDMQLHAPFSSVCGHLKGTSGRFRKAQRDCNRRHYLTFR